MLKQKRRMIRIVPASRAKNNFGEVLKRVYEKEETQIIERAGLPVAAIISMRELERFYPEKLKAVPEVAMSAKRKQAWRSLMKFLESVPEVDLPEDEVEADIQRAVDEVRHGKSKS